MSKIKIVLSLSILLIISCASAPEESAVEEQKPVPETVEQVQPEPEQEIIEAPEEPVTEEVVTQEPVEEQPVEVIEETPQEPVPEPLDENLILNAKKDIYKAEQAKAQTYYPARLKALKDKLSEAISLKDSDPDKARELLSSIKPESEQLTLDSLEALKLACKTILNDKTEQLIKLEADKYTPEEFELTQEQKEETYYEFENGDFAKSLELYRTTYTSLTNLYNSLNRNLSYIEKLLKMINNYKAQGEAIDVITWAPEEYEIAKESYINATKVLYNDYDAVNGEKLLKDTLFYAKKAIKQAEINIDVAKTDEEILNLMSELEHASTLTVLDREDNIISPEEWKGEADLKEKPIEANVEEDQVEGLTPVDLNKDVEVKYPEVSKNAIIYGETKVLGMREERKSLLAEAKELWAMGIEARNNGDLQSAHEYLAKSKVFLDEYKSMAVDYIYTVILNPERRDCLWRIAEKDDFYGDPLLWPTIWERNRKLIQDPDLIYPGWKLIIPPIEEE